MPFIRKVVQHSTWPLTRLIHPREHASSLVLIVNALDNVPGSIRVTHFLFFWQIRTHTANAPSRYARATMEQTPEQVTRVSSGFTRLSRFLGLLLVLGFVLGEFAPESRFDTCLLPRHRMSSCKSRFTWVMWICNACLMSITCCILNFIGLRTNLDAQLLG